MFAAEETLRAADSGVGAAMLVAHAQKDRAEAYKERAEKADADLAEVQALLGPLLNPRD